MRKTNPADNLIKILLIGDTHIPDRASSVPKYLVDVIEANRPWEVVVFTGDLTGESILRWARNLGHELYIVRGNMDYLSLRKSVVFEVNELKIGVHHGDGFYPRGDIDKLSKIAHSLGVDVLVSGHTHVDFIKVGSTGKELLLNPGSLTGVWGGGGGNFVPTLMVMEVAMEAVTITTFKARGSHLDRSVAKAYKKSDGLWVLEGPKIRELSSERGAGSVL